MIYPLQISDNESNFENQKIGLKCFKYSIYNPIGNFQIFGWVESSLDLRFQRLFPNCVIYLYIFFKVQLNTKNIMSDLKKCLISLQKKNQKHAPALLYNNVISRQRIRAVGGQNDTFVRERKEWQRGREEEGGRTTFRKKLQTKTPGRRRTARSATIRRPEEIKSQNSVAVKKIVVEPP